ncbi:MAG: hypothetical protein KBD78_02525 [Oligoflexales bacterium]|nr:hypothetical protein [Oligoflexales bacterium]
MGGALSTLADGLDAPYYNPANIGDNPWQIESGRDGNLKHFYLPAFNLSINENTQKLNESFKENNGTADKHVGETLVDAAAGKRQYIRASLTPGVVYGRLMFVPFVDQQGAAVSNGTDGEIEGHFRAQQGFGLGLSVPLVEDKLYFGVFGYSSEMTVNRGQYAYLDLINTETRPDILKATRYSYSIFGKNAGLLWRNSKVKLKKTQLRPSVALVVRNLNNATVDLKKAPAEPDPEFTEFEIKQDVSLGFSISPKLSNWLEMNFLAEAADLTDSEVEADAKIRTGLEFCFFGSGSKAPIKARTGYNSAGIAMGIGINLGLISLEVASYHDKIITSSGSKADRKTSALLAIDLAE